MIGRRKLAIGGLLVGVGVGCVTTSPALAQDAAQGWQTSADMLAEEKTRAETCVSILKRHTTDDPAALSRGQLTYADAKAEADAAIAGLTMALAQGGDVPVALSVIEGHLLEASNQREAFCAFAVEQIPSGDGASKQVMANVLSSGLEGLIAAAKDLYLNYRKETLLRRETMSHQIEAKKWREFEDIPG